MAKSKTLSSVEPRTVAPTAGVKTLPGQAPKGEFVPPTGTKAVQVRATMAGFYLGRRREGDVFTYHQTGEYVPRWMAVVKKAEPTKVTPPAPVVATEPEAPKATNDSVI